MTLGFWPCSGGPLDQRPFPGRGRAASPPVVSGCSAAWCGGSRRWDLPVSCLAQGSLAAAQRMRLSMQLGGFALALVVFGVGPVEASVGEPIEPAPSLAQQLQSLVEMVTTHPRDTFGCFLASQEFLDDIEAVMSLVLDNLFEFAHDNGDCQLILQGLTRNFLIAYHGSHALTDYACRCQDLVFLRSVGVSYGHILRDLCRSVELWDGASSSSFDALARFLKSNVEALRTATEMKVYHDVILPSSPELFLGDQEDSAGSAEAADLRRVEEIQEFKQKVCEDYKALADGVGTLFEQMIDELGNILGDLKGVNCAEAYEFLKERLDASFLLFATHDDELKSQVTGFKISFMEEPSEALALEQVRIFAKILGFKLQFPDMDHGSSWELRIFSRDEEFSGAFYDGPPLIESVMARVPEDPGEQSEFLARFVEVIKSLSEWVYSLYMDLKLGSGVFVADEQAKRWLNEVESNLCSVLERIGEGDRKQGLYNLTRTFEKWDSIAVNIERMLGILYGRENLRRGEGEPGCYLIKLRRVIGKVLGADAGVKSARAMQRPEEACGDEKLQEEGGQAGLEPDQSEGDGAGLAAESTLPDGCVAGGAIGGGAEECEALIDRFADGIKL